jgi:RimJ/RimL family protein N-acetyltransferase
MIVRSPYGSRGIASWMGTELSDGVVVLRAWSAADIPQIVDACQDPLIHRFIPIPWPYGVEDAAAYVDRTGRQWSEGTKVAFAVAEAGRPHVLLGAVNMAIAGNVGNTAYWVVPAARHQGVATRALRLIADWALHEVGMGVVLLEIHPTNEASIHAANASGFHEAGRLDIENLPDEQDHLIFSRLASDPDRAIRQ